jgi:hypothetical protein
MAFTAENDITGKHNQTGITAPDDYPAVLPATTGTAGLK